MGTSHDRFHRNLAAPVKAALHEVQSRLQLLVEKGPRALADALLVARPEANGLTDGLLAAIANELTAYADQEGL